MTEHSDALVLRDISKRFGAVTAVADASLTIRRAGITGLVGENGAGKSTLISMATGAQRPDTGTLTVGGESASAFDPRMARAAGIYAIRQEPILVPTISATENLLLGMEPADRGIYSEASSGPWSRLRSSCERDSPGKGSGRMQSTIRDS